MDECKTINVILQENGIIRSKAGNIIGRINTMDGLDFNSLHLEGIKAELGASSVSLDNACRNCEVYNRYCAKCVVRG